MSSVSIEIEVEASCSGCGSDLTIEVGTNSFGDIEASVAPCETCLDKSYEEGRSENG